MFYAEVKKTELRRVMSEALASRFDILKEDGLRAEISPLRAGYLLKKYIN
jgi:hypothetical protein